MLHQLEEKYTGLAEIRVVHNDDYDWEKLNKRLIEIIEELY